MTEDEIQRVINELKEWAGEEYGGQSALARQLGVPRQRINDWFTGKRTPELKSWLKIQEFLRNQKGGRPASRKTRKGD
jgi:DNA-binding XRE family transcriptional regulator